MKYTVVGTVDDVPWVRHVEADTPQKAAVLGIKCVADDDGLDHEEIDECEDYYVAAVLEGYNQDRLKTHVLQSVQDFSEVWEHVSL